jgi:hypothetical protein
MYKAQGKAQGKAARGRMRRENHGGGPATRTRTLNGEAGTAATAASPASPLRLDTQIKASSLRYRRNHERLHVHAQRAPPSSGRATDRSLDWRLAARGMVPGTEAGAVGGGDLAAGRARWSLAAGRGPSASVGLSATGRFQSGIRVSPTAATTSLSTRARHPSALSAHSTCPLVHSSTIPLSLSSPSSSSPLAGTPAAPSPPPPLAPCIACLPQ